MLQNIRHFILAAAAYYLAAQLGLTLAIPPGFASAVWPASGIALACTVLLNPRAAVFGSWAAAFLVDLANTSNHYTQLEIQNISAALFISTGSILQLLLAYVLCKQFIDLQQPLDAPRRIVLFTLLIVLLASTVSSSVGSSVLYFYGFIPAADIRLTWFTWWMGDAFGVLLFTPLLLNIFLYHQNFSLLRKLQIVLPTLVIFTITWMIFNTSINSLDNEEKNNAKHIMRDMSDTVLQRFNIAENKLTPYVALFRAEEAVLPNEFSTFSQVILDADTVFSAVGWTQIIPHAERENTELRLRLLGFHDFNFTEFNARGEIQIASPQSEYYPVLYIYPLEANRRAFGLNLGSNPERKAALLNARQLMVPVSTSPIILAQASSPQKAVILYQPVFKTFNGKEVFLGFVSGVLKIDDILGSSLDTIHQQGLSLTIVDITTADKPIDLVTDKSPAKIGFTPQVSTTQFGTRHYQISVYPNQNYPATVLNWTSWLIITAGVFVAAMLQLFILIITGSYAHVRNEVELKTRDLTLAMDKANFANQAKSRFFANMSHELRTPLNAIIGFIKLCLKTNLSTEQRNFLQKADLSSSTLLALINQSLDYAKIESGQFILENHAFSLGELLQKINAQFSLKALEKNLQFSIEYTTQVPESLTGDALRVEQILLNLLSNAFKFTEQGSVQLLLSYAEKNQIMCFIIRDTGIGINPQNVPHIFEAFRQAETSTSRRFGGTGLGLSISKELAQLMGGNIQLNSEPARGSEFQVNLHLPRAGNTMLDNAALQNLLHSNTASTTHACAPQTVSDIPLPLNGIRVVLAEDIEMNQELAKALLEGMGAKVEIAINGKMVLQMLENDPLPDVLLLDIQMPEMDGYETCKILRSDARYAELPIIAMTANAMYTDIQKCLTCGMQDHIAKPIDETLLLNTILRHLRD